MPNKRYYKEVQTTEVLKPEEEKELLKRAAQGDKEARDKLVMANQRYVIKLARKYYLQLDRKIDFQELVHIGNLGLLKALNKFDPSKNTRFLTYAAYWIRQTLDTEIKKYLRQEELLIFSLNIPVRDLDGDEDNEILNLLEDSFYPNPEQAIEQKQNYERIEQLVKTHLTDQESYIVVHVFGLGGKPKKKIKEIAEEMGISKQRVYYIIKRALNKLRKVFVREGLISH